MVASKIIRSYWDQPASEPPIGTEANLENPAIHNDGPLALLVVCIIFTVAAAASRMYSRLFSVKHLRVEDCMLLAFFGVNENNYFFANQAHDNRSRLPCSCEYQIYFSVQVVLS